MSECMLSLRVLARLLDYPSAELLAASPELIELIESETRWPQPLRKALTQWCRDLAASDLLDLEEAYVELFDRGRAVSLLLFEHVHGESRDRGQAMVNLLAEYAAAGFLLDARELPDHLPLFLEYLSTRDQAEIGQWLGEIQSILVLLGARLEERNSRYALVPRALLTLIGASDSIATQRPAASAEPADNTPQALDAVWEEEAVRFEASSDQDCSLQSAEGRRLAERKYDAIPQVIQVMPPSPGSGQ
ncbi:nitrate reductase [Pseudomonas sp. 10-1B]|uniref:nitrate reductase molybdenum cofactor assembly chaperone n=1 Tax=Pseudomonas sp. 10-1B TaxID=1546029 RepID=UPI00061F34AE|nr:nitrate reductase molybdenum cofactor assembly chaperone [Pseudomonas sp. 10-1B]KIY41236.1 nitrate reductase [Pseudomonas sp. 10-1B]